MIKITKFWDQQDKNHNITICFRPRVSFHVDQYIWSVSEKNIIEPKKIMKYRNNNYSLCIHLHPYRKGHKLYVPYYTPYNGELEEDAKPNDINLLPINNYVDYKKRNTWFCPEKNRVTCGEKQSWTSAYSTLVNEAITPREYASLFYDAIGAMLVYNYKSVTKDELDKAKEKIEWDYVNSFAYPAPFDEQHYLFDDNKIFCYSWDGRKMTALLEPIDAKIAYNEYFNKTKFQQFLYKHKIALRNLKIFLHYKKKAFYNKTKKTRNDGYSFSNCMFDASTNTFTAVFN